MLHLRHIPVVQDIREQMHVVRRRQRIGEEVRRPTTVDAVGQASFGDERGGDRCDGRLVEHRCHAGADVAPRARRRRCPSRRRCPAGGDGSTRSTARPRASPRYSPRQSMAAVKRRANASSCIATCQSWPLLPPPQLAGWPVRSTRTKSCTKGRSFSAPKYGARYHGDADVRCSRPTAETWKRPPRPLDIATRGEQRQHHVGGPRMEAEVRAHSLERRRVRVEPGEEVELDDRRGQQVGGVQAVAIAVQRER